MDNTPGFLRAEAQRYRSLARLLDGELRRRLLDEAEQAELMADRLAILLHELDRIARGARRDAVSAS